MQIRGTDDQMVHEIFEPILQLLSLKHFKIFLEDSMALVNLEVPALLLDGDKVVLQEVPDKDFCDAGKYLVSLLLVMNLSISCFNF